MRYHRKGQMRYGRLTSIYYIDESCNKTETVSVIIREMGLDIPALVVSLFPMLALTTAEPSCSQNASSESRKKTFDDPEDADDAADQQGEHEIDDGEVSHDDPSTMLATLPSHRLLLNSMSLDSRKFSISLS